MEVRLQIVQCDHSGFRVIREGKLFTSSVHWIHEVFLFTGITRTEILGNALIMLMAGYDTTANTMVFLAYCIAQEPEVQENLLKEINETKDKHVRNWVACHQIEDQTSRKEKSSP